MTVWDSKCAFTPLRIKTLRAVWKSMWEQNCVLSEQTFWLNSSSDYFRHWNQISQVVFPGFSKAPVYFWVEDEDESLEFTDGQRRKPVTHNQLVNTLGISFCDYTCSAATYSHTPPHSGTRLSYYTYILTFTATYLSLQTFIVVLPIISSSNSVLPDFIDWEYDDSQGVSCGVH